MHLKISSAKWRPFCPVGDELIPIHVSYIPRIHHTEEGTHRQDNWGCANIVMTTNNKAALGRQTHANSTITDTERWQKTG